MCKILLKERNNRLKVTIAVISIILLQLMLSKAYSTDLDMELMNASEGDDPATVKALLDKGADVN